MASQLTLRIASLLDAKGFEDVKRQLRDFTTQLRTSQAQADSLQSTFRQLTSVLAGAFAASGIKSFIASAIEEDRIVNTLANRFTILGEAGDRAAQAALRLTEQLARQTRFSQTEQLSAINILLRTTKSSAEAFDQLRVAQDIAAATGAELATASLAVARAQAGSAFFLSRITGLTSSFIREAQREGRLLDELREKFGGLAEKEGKTLAGQLEIIRNRFKEIGESIGEDFLPVVRTIAEALNQIPDSAFKTGLQLAALGAITTGVIGAFRLFGRALTFLGLNFGELRAILTLLPFAFRSVGSAIAFLTLPLKAMTGVVGLLVTGISGALFIFNTFKEQQQELQRQAVETAAGIQTFVRTLRLVRGEDSARQFASISEAIAAVRSAIVETNQQLGRAPEQARAALLAQRDQLRQLLRNLTDASVAEKEIGEISLEKEKERLRELTKSKTEARILDLLEQQQNLDAVLRVERLAAVDREAIERRLANVRLELNRLVTEQALESRRREVDSLRSQIDALRSLRLTPIEDLEQTEPAVLNRRLQTIRTVINAEKERVQEQLALELRAIEERQHRGELTDQQARQERLKAETAAAQEIAQVLQDALSEAKPVEEQLDKQGARSVRSLVEDLQRELARAAEQQKIALDLRIRFGDEEIDRIVQAVERGLRTLDIEVEHAARRKATVLAGEAE